MHPITQERIQLFRENIDKNGLDAFLILQEENRLYLSGFTGEDTGYQESSGALIISADTLMLATDSRFETQAKTEAPDWDIYCYKTGVSEAIAVFLQQNKCKKIGFETERLSYDTYCKINEIIKQENRDTVLVPANEIAQNMRITKSVEEREKICAALKIAEAAFEQVVTDLQPGMTERQIAWSLEKQMRERGADTLSFSTIIASGPNSALPHAIPQNRAIKKGEPILFDWGARRNGYCSDTSRTLVIGPPSNQFKEIYTILYDAQKKAIDAIKPGVAAKEVDSIARTHITKKGYGSKFGHGLGHGVGLEIHESPRLSPLSEAVLEPGMVITVEPGIYLPDWGGIRLEDMVYVTDTGAEVLNTLDLNHYQIDR